MGYSTGLVKYILKGPFTNPIAFYIYGAGLLALINAAPHLLDGNYIQMAVTYFVTKHLPPTSLGQVIVQTLIGTVGAGIKWFVFTPRIG